MTFESCDIKHLSISSVNLFNASPLAWCKRYLFKQKMMPNLYMLRGRIVENLVTNFLLSGEDITENDVKTEIESVLTAENGSFCMDDILPNVDEILRMVNNGLRFLKEFKEIPETQVKITLPVKIGEEETELLGYLDYYFLKNKKIIDLKSTTRVPSKFSIQHALQCYFYAKATGDSCNFLYVTAKKHKLLTLDDTDFDLEKTLKIALMRMKNFTEISSKETLYKALPASPDDFYLSDGDLCEEYENAHRFVNFPD